MRKVRILHLVDDTTAGGIMRMLDHLINLPDLALAAEQDVLKVNKGSWSFGQLEADVIISHLTLNWRVIPALMSLRSMHPDARILHVEHSYTRAFSAINISARRRFFSLLRVGYSLFDHVVAVSENQAKWLNDRDLVKKEDISIIHPEVDLSAFQQIAPKGKAPKVLGAIGRLEPQKGFDVLIKAFRKCERSDLKLIFFGDGGERGKLEALAQGDPRIEFRGHTLDPVAAIEEVDAVVMPSRWESYGIVAREALAASRPVILSSVDGLTDIVSDNVVFIDSLQSNQWSQALANFQTGPATSQERGLAPNPGQKYASKWLKVITNGAEISDHPSAPKAA